LRRTEWLGSSFVALVGYEWWGFMETTLDVDFYEESQFLHDIDRWQELMPVEYPASIHDARKVGVASFQFATASNVISLLNRTARLVMASTCFAAVDHRNHECRCPSSRLWWPIGWSGLDFRILSGAVTAFAGHTYSFRSSGGLSHD